MVMLAIVLLYYLRMIGERSAKRKHSSKVSAVLAKVDVFESAANDRAALKVVKEGLQDFPDNPALLERYKAIELRLKEDRQG